MSTLNQNAKRQEALRRLGFQNSIDEVATLSGGSPPGEGEEKKRTFPEAYKDRAIRGALSKIRAALEELERAMG